MMAIAFDTLAFVKRLTEAGVEQKQAEAQAQAQATILSELIDDKLASRQDIIQMEHKLDNKISELDNRISGLDARISQLEARITNTIFKSMGWGVSLIIGLNVILHYLPGK